MHEPSFSRLGRSLTVTLFLTLLVILAGATVRATGSGMGCPDWPLCYGCWIPPVSVDQLPEDYARRYAVEGREAVFDPVKTWIEYINRLLGAAAGASMLVTAVLTIPVAGRRPSLVVLALLSLGVLGFTAWLGARVVGTFLAPHAVTLHLAASYGLLVLLLGQRELVGRRLQGPRPVPGIRVTAALAVVGAALVLQGLLGIRTREEIEAWIWNHELAATLWSAWGGAYDLHKAAGVLTGLAAGVLAWTGWKGRTPDPRLRRLTAAVGLLVAAQGAVGLVLWWGGLPGWAKPLHVLFSTGAWAAWAAAVLHTLPSGVPKRV